MKFSGLFILTFFLASLMGCTTTKNAEKVSAFETSSGGNKLASITPEAPAPSAVVITLKPNEKYQTITGFGGSFTQASAYLLNRLSPANREKVLQAYFGADGANYSLTRTHFNSCDFSLGHYAYDTVAGDVKLEHFSIQEDEKELIPIIKSAQKISADGFKIISSPWTAPPWMKDNNDWRGGKLLPQYRDAWALYFSKYIKAYKNLGIDIWGVTVENEPLGNGNNWESMIFSPAEMTEFVNRFLGPKLENEGLGHVQILGYDQNRGEELIDWAKTMFAGTGSKNYFDGTAVHWYASTYDYFPESLQFTHKLSGGKYLINTEACVDADVPAWKNDDWYWNAGATDWGWDWAPENQKYLHPKYEPAFRYARDIIGCLNNYVDGWIDWNLVLDRQGGPNWFKNWCVAPVIADIENDEVYITPLYYLMAHFSKFIRPGAVRIGFENPDNELMITAAQNPDKSVAAVIFNPGANQKHYKISLRGKEVNMKISPKALQTIVFK